MMPNKKICACANPDCPTVGIYEPDSACSMCGMRMLFAPGVEIDVVSATAPLIQAVREFLQNVRSHNVAGLGDLACDPSLKQMESALRDTVVCLEFLTDANEFQQMDSETGKKWREDSSLENWFPYTAEELSKLRALVTEVYLVASGERQVAHDDTSALAWISERCKKP